MKQEPLRVGIAGYGIVGKRRRKCLDADPRANVVAVCDKKFENSGSFDDGVIFHSKPSQLFDHKLDALFVCLTNDLASAVTIEALKRGVHVFCEKPPGRNVQDIENVIEVERRHPGLKLKYGFNHRYHDSVREALRIVRSGELGDVINLRGVYGKSMMITFNQDDWRTKREIAGGGILLDQGIHMVDLIRLFGGDFSEFRSFIMNDFWHYDVEDNAYALMRTGSGVVAMLHSSATQWRHRFKLEISLTSGALILSGILSGSKSYGAETLTVVQARPHDDGGDPCEQRTKFNKDNSWQDEISDFVEAIVDGHPIRDGSSDDALKTMQHVFNIYCADPEWRGKFDLDMGKRELGASS